MNLLLAQTLNHVGNWHFNRGQARQALTYHNEALALFRKQENRRGIAQIMDLLGIVSYQLGEINYLQLTKLSDEALQSAHSFHWYLGEAFALMLGTISLEKVVGHG